MPTIRATITPLSPIFHGIHVAAGAVPAGGTALFFAFQNGFFWQAVFAGFQQKAPQAETAPA